MEGILVSIRRLVSGIVERIRRLVAGRDEATPIFRELVRNGGFEQPVIERNYWSRNFDPAKDGWTGTTGSYAHTRTDGGGADGSNQLAMLMQGAITQNLNTSGLEGSRLDVSLAIGGHITVTLGASTHSWRAEDKPGVEGGWWRVSFSHVVAPGDVPSLQLKIRGDWPEEFEPGTGIEIVHDYVDSVSVLAWRSGTEAAVPIMAHLPGGGPPVVIHRQP
jgi:hypothetical protein